MTDNDMSKRTRSKRVIQTLASPIDLSVWDPRPRRATRVKSKRDDAPQIDSGQYHEGSEWPGPGSGSTSLPMSTHREDLRTTGFSEPTPDCEAIRTPDAREPHPKMLRRGDRDMTGDLDQYGIRRSRRLMQKGSANDRVGSPIEIPRHNAGNPSIDCQFNDGSHEIDYDDNGPFDFDTYPPSPDNDPFTLDETPGDQDNHNSTRHINATSPSTARLQNASLSCHYHSPDTVLPATDFPSTVATRPTHQSANTPDPPGTGSSSATTNATSVAGETQGEDDIEFNGLLAEALYLLSL